ncbi:MAG TPA: hypothetical protein VMT34_04520 [Aggregatilineales bacterium]|nr:hypothetical protein [Aggregatilineales bacterium]
MDDNRLQVIQTKQFHDRVGAEALLLDFVRETFPDLDVTAVELRPLAVSLNSFNGLLTRADGTKLFFKTHVEPGSVVREYYNSKLLAEAGYPIIEPKYASTDYGKQFLIYDVIDSPSVFDVARAIDRGTPLPGADLEALTAAQQKADDALLDIYLRSLQWQSADDAAKAPVHQLFYHRLGERYQQFYEGKPFVLPGGIALAWEDLCSRRLSINGVPYREILGDAILRARDLLEPAREGWSVVGHGDAHNGNLFFSSDRLVYFDPAFAGHHHPLLDLAKPLFHNSFATWMYHPDEIGQTLEIELHHRESDRLYINHNYTLSPCREMFLNSKRSRLYEPFLREVRGRDGWTPDSNRMLRAALMCCPLFTMNLADRERFSPEVALLGLCFVFEMGVLNFYSESPIEEFVREP